MAIITKQGNIVGMYKGRCQLCKSMCYDLLSEVLSLTYKRYL